MSGSMIDIRDATVEGTRGYLADLQKEERKLIKEHGEGVYTYFTVTAFDTVCETFVNNVPAAEFKLSDLDQYEPRGGTALHDAIAQTVTTMSTRVKDGDKVLVVVMTDGKENASVEYQGETGRLNLLKMVKAHEKKGNWTFVYLGAKVDAVQQAASFGIPVGNAVYYSSTASSVGATASSLYNVTTTLRSTSGNSTFTAFADAGESQDFRDDTGATNV